MTQLIPFDEVSRLLALSRRTYLGLREIPVERIVGAVASGPGREAGAGA